MSAKKPKAKTAKPKTAKEVSDILIKRRRARGLIIKDVARR